MYSVFMPTPSGSGQSLGQPLEPVTDEHDHVDGLSFSRLPSVGVQESLAV